MTAAASTSMYMRLCPIIVGRMYSRLVQFCRVEGLTRPPAIQSTSALVNSGRSAFLKNHSIGDRSAISHLQYRLTSISASGIKQHQLTLVFHVSHGKQKGPKAAPSPKS